MLGRAGVLLGWLFSHRVPLHCVSNVSQLNSSLQKSDQEEQVEIEYVSAPLDIELLQPVKREADEEVPLTTGLGGTVEVKQEPGDDQVCCWER